MIFQKSVKTPGMSSVVMPGSEAPAYLRIPRRLDQLAVAIGVLALQVIQESAALADELQQPAAGMMVLGVRLEMVGQVVDALAEECDLNFR